jgi:uncharacterized membrane protein required for colicin V production
VTLDLACLAVVVLAAVRGAFTGIIPRLTQLAAVVAGWAGARALGPSVAPLLQGSVPPFAAHPLASVLTFVGCTVLALILVRALLALTPLGRVRGSGGDRAVGALLAAGQAAIVLWVGLSALAVWSRPLQIGSARLDPASSELVAFAREHSALGALARWRDRPAAPPEEGSPR